MADNTTDFSSISREQFLERAKQAQEKLRQENKDKENVDFKLGSGWWKPVFDFKDVLHASVPKETNDKLTAASKEFSDANYSREAYGKFAAETRDLLAGYPQALQCLENTVLKNPSAWDTMHKYALEKQSQGLGTGKSSCFLAKTAEAKE